MKKAIFATLISSVVAMSLNAAVVASVNGDKITDEDVKTLLNSAMPGFDITKLPAETKKRVIEDLVNRKLLIQDAKNSDIEKSSEYKKAMQVAKDNIAVDVYMKKIFDDIKVTDNELKDFYNKEKSKFTQSETARAKHILVTSQKEADEILSQLKNLKGEALNAKFSELATSKSIDKGSASNGGELGWFGKSQMVKPFSDAVFAMKDGEISKSPVKTNFGYHIILKEESKPAGTTPFKDVKDQILNNLKLKKFQEIIRNKSEELRKKAKIEINNL